MLNGEEEKTTVRLIEEGLYLWFLGGIFGCGAVIVPIGRLMFYPEMPPATAWIEGLASALVVFLLIDNQGNFHWARTILAISFAIICEYVFNHILNYPISVYGFVIYAVFGAIGMWFGKIIRQLQGKETNKESNE